MHFSDFLFVFFLLCLTTAIGELHAHRFKRSQKRLEKSIATQSSMVATLSHEIRNPLTGILSVLQLLDNTTLDKNQKNLLTVAGESGQNLLSLLNNTLQQSPANTTTPTTPSTLFHLETVIQPLLTFFSCQAQQKGVMLTAHISPLIPTDIAGDAEKFRQILCNLLSNAIRFTNSGIIKLHVDIKHICETNKQLYFCVADTGTGIPADALEDIFKPYQQARNAAAHPGGTGLGLSISRQLARSMGGDIHVSSMEGRGSLFTLILPWHTTDAVSHQHNAQSLRFLVVDDSDVHRLAVCTQLEILGHNALAAANARDAFTTLYWQSVDVIFLDVHLPDANAIHCIQQIQAMAQKTGKPLPRIIAVSAWLDHTEVEQLLAQGADAVCTKPLAADVVQQMLAALSSEALPLPNLLSDARFSVRELPPQHSTRIS